MNGAPVSLTTTKTTMDLTSACDRQLRKRRRITTNIDEEDDDVPVSKNNKHGTDDKKDEHDISPGNHHAPLRDIDFFPSLLLS